MARTSPLPLSRHASLALASLLLAALLGGCGGVGSFSGGDGNAIVRTLQLRPQNYDLLTSLTPTLSQNWYTAPLATPVTINASFYDDGLKAAVYADEIRTGLNRYHLGGQYSALGVVFGVVAEEPDSPSWTTFRFWGDGRELALPHFVKKGERRQVFVDVRGVQDFDLIAEGIPQTDGISYVSTKIGWGDGTFIKEAGIDYLADLTPTATSGWSPAPTEGTIWIDWHPFPHSMVGTIRKGAPAASLTYHLDGRYTSFASVAGISQYETDSGATVTLQVRVDGVLRDGGTVSQQSEKLFHLEVTGADLLEVRAQVASASEEDIDIGWGMALVAE